MNLSSTNTGIVAAALKNDYDNVVKILREFPDAVNEQDQQGMSALMVAAGRGHLRIVQLICSCPEVSWSLVDNSGRTALDLAYGQTDILKQIIRSQFGGVNLSKPEVL